MGTDRISELAGRTGLPATTLRYYEKERLLPADRTPAGYRVYTDADADRVQLISAAKHLWLPLDQIRDLSECGTVACAGRSATNSARWSRPRSPLPTNGSRT